MMDSSEPRRRASGRRDLLVFWYCPDFCPELSPDSCPDCCPDVWVADPRVVPHEKTQIVMSFVPHPWWIGGGCMMGGFVPIRGWTHRVTTKNLDFAGGDAHSVVKPRPLRDASQGRDTMGGFLWGEAFAVGVKLRRIGPMVVASVAYCIVEPRLGRGEKRLQLQVFVTRPRGVGRGVTFRLECEDDDWVGIAPGPFKSSGWSPSD